MADGSPGYAAILNAAAGRGRAAALLDPVVAHLRDGGAEVAVHAAESLAHARALAGDAARAGAVVVAAGGDGLVGATAGAVADAGGVLGLVPAGRGNDFARNFGLPADPRGLAGVLRAGTERQVDLLDCGGTAVAGSVFAGIDSAANVVAARRPRIPDAVLYQAAALWCLASWKAPAYEVTTAAGRHEVRGYTVVAANSPFYGGGLRVAPDAVLDDGELDVVAIGSSPRLRFPGLLAQMRSGAHVERPEVTTERAPEVTIAADADLVAYGDGEPLGPLPVTVRVRPRALRILTP